MFLSWRFVSTFERKGPILFKFLFLIAHNDKAVLATGLKPGTAILQQGRRQVCKSGGAGMLCTYVQIFN